MRRSTKWNARALFVALAFSLCASRSEAHGPWQVIKQCREIPNDSNDGDSFHVRAAGKEYIFRIYFADAPETEDSFPERVGEQAKYFGLTTAQTLRLGGYAKKFAEEKMMKPFTIRTCMQDALGRSRNERFYAFVETDDGDLAELLISNGLARVHGSAATPVGLSSPEREWEKLRRLELEARKERIGGWGASTGRMMMRARQVSKSGPDSFDAFFHPEKLIAREQTPPASPTANSSAVTKLDLNTASENELEAVKGIGPVLAARIIAARPFNTPADLRRVKGIGPKKYELMRPFFEGAAAPAEQPVR